MFFKLDFLSPSSFSIHLSGFSRFSHELWPNAPPSASNPSPPVSVYPHTPSKQATPNYLQEKPVLQHPQPRSHHPPVSSPGCCQAKWCRALGQQGCNCLIQMFISCWRETETSGRMLLILGYCIQSQAFIGASSAGAFHWTVAGSWQLLLHQVLEHSWLSPGQMWQNTWKHPRPALKSGITT